MTFYLVNKCSISRNSFTDIFSTIFFFWGFITVFDLDRETECAQFETLSLEYLPFFLITITNQISLPNIIMETLNCLKWNNFIPNWPKSRRVKSQFFVFFLGVPEDERKPFNSNDVTQAVDIQTKESDELFVFLFFADDKCKNKRQIYITQFECELIPSNVIHTCSCSCSFRMVFFPYSLWFQIEYFLILITAVCFGCVHYRYILICGASWLSVTILLNIYIFSNSVIICMQYASNNANVMDELNCHFYQKYTSICRSWQHYCTMRNGSNLEWDGMM